MNEHVPQELTKPNGSNIKTNIPARDVVELQKIVEKRHPGYKLKEWRAENLAKYLLENG